MLFFRVPFDRYFRVAACCHDLQGHIVVSDEASTNSSFALSSRVRQVKKNGPQHVVRQVCQLGNRLRISFPEDPQSLGAGCCPSLRGVNKTLNTRNRQIMSMC